MGGVVSGVVGCYTEANELEKQLEKENAPFELLDRISSIEDIESEFGK